MFVGLLHRIGVGPARALVGAVAIAIAASACTSAHASANATATHGSSKPPLVIYSAQGYDSAMAKAFQQATGIQTKLVDDSTGPLLARIQAERNNPQWDVVWVDGNMAFAALDREGLLHKGYEPSAPYTSLGQSLVPSDKSYIPTGVTTMVAVVYDSRRVSHPPTTWQDLLAPQWRNAIGMNDPSVSGPTYGFVAGMMQQLGGVSAGQKYFETLKAHGMLVFQTNGDTLHALETGQIKLALVQSSAAIGAGLQSKTIKYVFPSQQTLMPSCIGISAAARGAVLSEAERFAQFVLSPAGQQVMQSGDPQGDSLYWPVVTGVDPLPALPPFSSLQALSVDPYEWGAREASLNQWFDANVKP